MSGIFIYHVLFFSCVAVNESNDSICSEAYFAYIDSIATTIHAQTWALEAHSISLLQISESKKYGELYHFSVVDDEIYSYAQKPVVKYIYSYEHGIIYFEQLTPIDEGFVFIPYVLISEQGLGAVKGGQYSESAN